MGRIHFGVDVHSLPPCDMILWFSGEYSLICPVMNIVHINSTMPQDLSVSYLFILQKTKRNKKQEEKHKSTVIPFLFAFIRLKCHIVTQMNVLHINKKIMNLAAKYRPEIDHCLAFGKSANGKFTLCSYSN